MPEIKWTKIDDSKVRHIWVLDDGDQCLKEEELCNEDKTTAVSPDWYAENGTPICPGCGEDMVYSHTEIREE